MAAKLVGEIAKRLRAARKAAGYKSAKDFANTQNVPISTYSQHETGKRSINSELMLAYSLKLEIHPYWLLTGNGDPYIDVIELEKNLISKQENYPYAERCIKKSNGYKLIDFNLLKKVLLSMESLFNDKSITLSYQELITYCFDVYDIVSTLTVSSIEKEKIINLTISSLKRGNKTDIKLNEEKFVN